MRSVPRSTAEVALQDAPGPPHRRQSPRQGLTASVVDDAAEVLAAVFDEAELRRRALVLNCCSQT
jgi:hypothetical protein